MFMEFWIVSASLTSNQSISDGDTLVSLGQRFELGFFSPGSSKNRYLGIWYKNAPGTVVWVANREKPITDSYGVLIISTNGTLVLLNQMKSLIWSSNISRVAGSPIVQLLDSGNLVITDMSSMNPESYIWQSFDFPSDTRLAGQKMGHSLSDDLDRHLVSWKSADDPSPGDFTYIIDNHGLPQLVIVMGSIKKYRSGGWNGVRFSGLSSSGNPTFSPNFVFKDAKLYCLYEPYNYSVITRLTLNHLGVLERYRLNERSTEWSFMYSLPKDRCDSYGQCGANGICKIYKSPVCECLKGFIPKSQEEWELLDWSSGCVRRMPLDCQSKEGFVKIEGVKLPDFLNFWLNKSMSLKECREECFKKCSCKAYANSNISDGGSGCLMWFGDLIDVREFTEEDDSREDEDSSQDIYIRLAASELRSIHDWSKKKRLVITLVAAVVFGMLILGVVLWFTIWKKKRKTEAIFHFLRMPMEAFPFIFFYTLISFSVSEFSTAFDSITPNQSIITGESLVSVGQSFELGFFSTGASKNCYLGIWYKSFPQTVVWVANRENPLTDSYGSLTINSDGNLVLLNSTKGVVWSSNSSRTGQNPVAQLLDSGNLVLREKGDSNTESYIWQSFDFPSDTQLPDMKLGWNLSTGLNRYLTSWKDTSDPSPGDFTYGVENIGLPQIVLSKGSEKKFRTGAWNGVGFSGVGVRPNPIFDPSIVFNTDEFYYMYKPISDSLITRFVLNQSGMLQRFILNAGSSEWALIYTVQNDLCDDYGQCGPNGICRINRRPICLESNKEDIELPFFDLATIATATWNFSSTNMIGEGGFGPVYKIRIEEYHSLGKSALILQWALHEDFSTYTRTLDYESFIGI
ncbi:hypothetical protein F0562_008885 [Nyssa sinensis]|uniref:Non-specific serine/threonine protein kinase n=1 Tax=Nyssa sinensis TaxID=561372 RepID=A0A5J5AAX0_9ASTE|nr:hypothetical protein F0562_008885 [Nyssa sinensis]